jgi:hypothetical protein
MQCQNDNFMVIIICHRFDVIPGLSRRRGFSNAEGTGKYHYCRHHYCRRA